MFAPDTPGRESGGYPQPGAIQDMADHPDNDLPGPMQPAMKHSTEMAGDVIPIQTDFSSYAKARDAQGENKKSMEDIAKRGPSAVDTSNLTVYRKK